MTIKGLSSKVTALFFFCEVSFVANFQLRSTLKQVKFQGCREQIHQKYANGFIFTVNVSSRLTRAFQRYYAYPIIGTFI